MPKKSKHPTDKNRHSIMTTHNRRLKEFEVRLKKSSTTLKEINHISRQLEKLLVNKHDPSIKEAIELTRTTLTRLRNAYVPEDIVQTEYNEYILDSCRLLSDYIDIEKTLEDTENVSETVINQNIRRKGKIMHMYRRQFELDGLETSDFSELFDEIYCAKCKCTDLILGSDGWSTCNECGLVDKAQLPFPSDLSFKEYNNYTHKHYFSYKRQSHFIDWLRRFQSREQKTIPSHIIDCVLAEAASHGITDLSLLTELQVRGFLKKHKHNTYFSNVITIVNRINGRKPFVIHIELEDKLMKMFAQIQEPFAKFKPNNRKNFLSYSYTLNKFFKILGLEEYSKYFHLLKSTDKLRQQDEIFKKIVEYMAKTDKTGEIVWTFYPSF